VLSLSSVDDTVGADLVSQCARPGSRLSANPRDMYLAFGAAAAVLQFVECGGGGSGSAGSGSSRGGSQSFNELAGGAMGAGGGSLEPPSVGCPGTVIVTCRRSEHFMTVDPTTARNLEIAAPLV